MRHRSKANSRETRDLRGRELRVVQDGGIRSVEGYAVVFDSPSVNLGGFTETVSRGALARTLREQPDVLCLRDHDSSMLLGRTTSGTLSLTEDATGLKFRVALPNTTTGNDLAASLERGDIDACSFGFSTRKDAWNQAPDGTITRSLEDVELFEVSIVSFPAYPATTAALRSAPPEIRSALRSKVERRDDGCECPCPECLAGDCLGCSDPDCDCESCICDGEVRAAAQAEDRDWRETFELAIELRKRRAV